MIASLGGVGIASDNNHLLKGNGKSKNPGTRILSKPKSLNALGCPLAIAHLQSPHHFERAAGGGGYHPNLLWKFCKTSTNFPVWP